MNTDLRLGEIVYENPLSSPSDVEGWILEGQARISFDGGRMEMRNALDAEEGQKANFVYWCDRGFPDNIALSWDFWPLEEPGLCIIFFAAVGQGGRDLFDPALNPRTGEYQQYHSGDINALHLSYFRRRHESERAFHTCNLRRSAGFHMVAQGADPLPDVGDARPPYHIQLIKAGPLVHFAINDLPILEWVDDGETWGPVLTGGRIGFRQMAPLRAQYANLRIQRVEKA
jgi:hypothetical protein